MSPSRIHSCPTNPRFITSIFMQVPRLAVRQSGPACQSSTIRRHSWLQPRKERSVRNNASCRYGRFHLRQICHQRRRSTCLDIFAQELWRSLSLGKLRHPAWLELEICRYGNAHVSEMAVTDILQCSTSLKVMRKSRRRVRELHGDFCYSQATRVANPWALWRGCIT